FSPNLAKLRRRLETTSVHRIYSFNCHSNHYSAYATAPYPSLRYGDSMHRKPDSTILSIFQWFLSGTGFTVPTSVEVGAVAHQGGGSGSCGIAALNFVETELNPDVGKWGPLTSPFFRNRALRDLIVYDLTATTDDVNNTYSKWVTPCLAREPLEEIFHIDHGPVGYNDFNLDAPNVRIF
ncbi:hypothetical protein C8R46DRAFT_1281572, partial [Mycena filopes]